MKIISEKKWNSINLQIKSLRDQICELTDETIAKDNEVKRLQKDNANLLQVNGMLNEANEYIENKYNEKDKECRKLKTILTKNKIDYKSKKENKNDKN